MSPIPHSSRALALALLSFALAAPAAAAVKQFVPSAETAAGVTPSAARKAFRAFFGRERTLEHSTFAASNVAAARVTPAGIELDLKGGGGEKIPWAELDLLVLVKKNEVKLRDGAKLYCADAAEAERLGNALFVLKRERSPEAAAEREEAFRAAAAAYRDAAKKPELPEAAHRFRVQAEDAVKEKRFEDAADHYGEALSVAPWWTAGRFNRALILGDLGESSEAIVEMKRYLALVPDAPNARAAQDKIYAWEAKTAP